MTTPLSQDLRRRLVRPVEAGSSTREATRRFEVSASAAVTLARRVRETGSTALSQIGGYRKSPLAGDEAVLREPTTSLPGYPPGRAAAQARRARDRGGLVDSDPGHAAPPRPVAQKKPLRAAEQDRTDVAARRRPWRRWQPSMGSAAFVFIDASSPA